MYQKGDGNFATPYAFGFGTSVRGSITGNKKLVVPGPG